MNQRTEMLLARYMDGLTGNAEEAELAVLLQAEEQTAEVRAALLMLGDRGATTDLPRWTEGETVPPRARVIKNMVWWLAAAAAIALMVVNIVLHSGGEEKLLAQQDSFTVAKSELCARAERVSKVAEFKRSKVREFESREVAKAESSKVRKFESSRVKDENNAQCSMLNVQSNEELAEDYDLSACQELAARITDADEECQQLRETLLSQNYYED